MNRSRVKWLARIFPLFFPYTPLFFALALYRAFLSAGPFARNEGPRNKNAAKLCGESNGMRLPNSYSC